MPIRAKQLPGRFSDEELADLHQRAFHAGYKNLSSYVRARLKMPEIQAGAPVGNNNNPCGRKGKSQ